MTTILTTAGAAHVVELDAPSALTNAFDGLTFGQGNDTPDVGDEYGPTPAVFTQELGIFVSVEAGYPKLADGDTRNTGASAGWWTWKFIIPAGTYFVASNLLGVNYSGGVPADESPALFSGKETLAQRYDERMIVWVNVEAGAIAGDAVTIATAKESALENRITRVVGFVASNRGLSTHPNGSVVDSVTVRARPQVGQYVWTAADIVGVEGRALTPSDVAYFRVEVQKWIASEGTWKPALTIPLDQSTLVTGARVFNDARWNAPGGFNVAHTWTPPAGSREGTWRLRYRMQLSDGDVREWRSIVEVRDGRS